MDEKGDAAMVLGDDEPENDERGNVPVVGKPELVADASKSRISVKEKLAEMSARINKDKAGVQKSLEKSNMAKMKGKEESL